MKSEITTAVKEFAAKTKKILKENLVREYLFGSYAKAKENEQSDIDILIIVKKSNRNLRKEISSLSSYFSIHKGIVISPIIKNIEIWEKNREFDTFFYREITKYGIEL